MVDKRKLANNSKQKSPRRATQTTQQVGQKQGTKAGETIASNDKQKERK